MILNNILTEVGERLDTIEGLRVHKYEDDADEIQVPAALISLPPNVDYSKTYSRTGGVEMDIIITILVSLADARIRRKQLAGYADTQGPKSIKWVLETGTYSSFDSIAILKGNFTVLTIAEPQASYKAFIASGKIFGS